MKVYLPLFCMILISVNAFSNELCSPIGMQSANRDELGGVVYKSHQDLVRKIEKQLSKENWVSLNESIKIKSKNQCTRLALVPRSSVYMYTNSFGHRAYDFLKALSVEKKNILKFYRDKASKKQKINITDEEYNRLAYLSVGILGAESRSGKSLYYYAEHLLAQSDMAEQIAACLNNILKGKSKRCLKYTVTSRGPTQIKAIPEGGVFYGVTRDNLYDPYLAGIATVSFLIESYKEYKNLINNNSYQYVTDTGSRVDIRKEDFEVFMTYLYRGAKVQLVDGTATPHKNCYYKRAKKHQDYVDVYVQPEEDCSKAGKSILE